MGEIKRISLTVDNMMADIIGMPYGVDPGAIDALAPYARKAQESVQANRGKGMLGWMDLPYNQADVLGKIEAVAARVRATYDAFVVLGIGGSALGPIAVQQALNHLRWNELPKERRKGPKFYVEDNIDPERMASLLDVIDAKKTCFNIITKSGATAETMSQYLIISDMLRREVGKDFASHIIATTDKSRGNLCPLAREEGFETFVIPDGVGGRFSELSPVGLLAAAVCNIDIRAMLEGAKVMDAACQCGDVWRNPALLEAALQYLLMTDMDVNIQVMLPYADSLRSIADWFCQLWAESLGKNITRKGMAVNFGQTPVKALGVTDQHSQLQLYTEGPYDKVVTFLKVDKFRAETAIPNGCGQFPDVAFLGGKTHAQLIEAERQGTEYALCRAGRMNQTITLPEITPHTIGQLLYFFEMTTAYMGEFLDIDAFNQPGVEESKLASFAVLGHEAEKFASKRAEMARQPERKERYTV